jgi:hypothetical protein
MIALASLLLLAEAGAALSLTQFEALPPLEAGVRALEGKAHRAIVKVEPVSASMAPPGIYEYRSLEEPVDVAGGCQRTRWTATFTSGRNPRDQAVLRDVHAGTEVALKRGASCELAAFAYLNPGSDADRALFALQQLREIAEGRRDAEFACRTESGPDICAGAQTIRQALQADPYLMTARKGETAEITLGSPTTRITRVSFDPRDPATVQVVRTIPAPF